MCLIGRTGAGLTKANKRAKLEVRLESKRYDTRCYPLYRIEIGVLTSLCPINKH